MTQQNAAVPWTVQRITATGSEAERIRVVLEEPLAISINGHDVAVLMRLPGMEKELAVGYCLSEGLISHPAAIQLVQHCGRGLPAPDESESGEETTSRNRVQIRALPEAVRPGSDEAARLVRSGCGATGFEVGDLDLVPVASQAQVNQQVLLGLNAAMRQRQSVFQDIGAVHAAAVFTTSGDLVTLQEDIGRHNAVDKAIGHCLLHWIELEDKIIATTGRASYEMVSKAIRVGIPVVASVSSPTSLAIQVAQEYRCTLIGYMRGNRFSVYTHAWRIRLA